MYNEFDDERKTSDHEGTNQTANDQTYNASGNTQNQENTGENFVQPSQTGGQADQSGIYRMKFDHSSAEKNRQAPEQATIIIITRAAAVIIRIAQVIVMVPIITVRAAIIKMLMAIIITIRIHPLQSSGAGLKRKADLDGRWQKLSAAALPLVLWQGELCGV